jgi:hypothetical protein
MAKPLWVTMNKPRAMWRKTVRMSGHQVQSKGMHLNQVVIVDFYPPAVTFAHTG